MLKTKESTNLNHVLLINQASFPFCFHQVLGEIGCINYADMTNYMHLYISRQLEQREK